jgi:electron-transferring-flavoprotein dehydrogenase
MHSIFRGNSSRLFQHGKRGYPKVADTSICATRCAQEFGNPCQRFCPANVHEMVDNGAGGKMLRINAANCVHCKACDIKDPYGIITWTTPEGGSGPNYQNL